MKEQRENYITRCLERLAPMESHANNFAQSPWDVDNLRQLHEHFHQVAGSAGIHQMGDLANIAQSGERLCMNIFESQPDDIIVYWRHFRDMIQQMKTVLEQAQSPSNGMPPSGGPPVSGGSTGGPPITSPPMAKPPSYQPQQEQRTTSSAEPPISSQPPLHGQPPLSFRETAVPQATSGHHLAPLQSGANFVPAAVWNPDMTPNPVTQLGPDVIVVSSDQNRLNALAQRLDNLGMRVRPCPTWNEAKNQILSSLPAGLLLCVPLKDGNGYDLVAGCRSLPGGESVSVVLLSEEPGFLDKIAAIKSGADASFELPVEVDVIVQKLRFLFERTRPERYRILSVEDDPEQASYLVSQLEEAGYHLAWVQDPKKFEEALLTFCPDLILLDIVMGEINGFDLAKFVRQNERFATVPIVFLTTQNQLEAHIESARTGGDDHLIKPVNPQLLVATIAGRLERYRIFQRLLKNDGLTQILNHSHFMEYAQRSVRIRSKKFSQVLTIFDIDGLQRINDTFGYAVGDRTILALVQIIKWTFRHTDLIGRIGGDEIAVLDDSLTIHENVEVLRGLLEQFAGVPHKASGEIFKVTASAGVSHLSGEGTLQTLLDKATGALAKAKSLGDNQVVVF
ncbi:MAG: diguanylate cyclase [Candidatus Obscuribacterales bacterium]|nr:diguanylate cyclase [Candidatus Obscuribacterales bacterium]